MKLVKLIQILLFSSVFIEFALTNPDSPSPIPIVPSRDRDSVPKRGTPLPPLPSSPSPFAWNGWSSHFPGFGQTNWPNSLLGFPSLFPGPISAEEPARTLQRDEKSLVEKELNSTTMNSSSTQISQQFVGIRARFNPPIFEEISRLFYSVFNHEAQHIQIRPQKQCFAEGCFRLHTFRIVGFQRPRAITLKPLAPNLLLLNILSFDVDIESLLNGNVQLLLTAVPVTGNFHANTRQLSITALFDLQKDQNKVPYLRMASCELRSGTVSTKVSNLGLLTDSINLKYKTEMLEKARELITSTICETISDTIRERVNQVLRRLPRAISVATILGAFSADSSANCSSVNNNIPHSSNRASTFSPSPSAPISFQFDEPPQRFFSNKLTVAYGPHQRVANANGWNRRFWSGQWQQRRRRKRGMEMIGIGPEKMEQRGKGNVEEITSETIQQNKIGKKEIMRENEKQNETTMATEIRLREQIINGKKGKGTQQNGGCTNMPSPHSVLLDFLDLDILGQIFIELDFVDSNAGQDFFGVGLSGDVFLRMPHQVSYVGGGVREVLMGSALWERSSTSKNGSNEKREKGNNGEEEEEEDKSLLMKEMDDVDGQHQQQRQFPPILPFPSPSQFRKTLEIIFSDLTVNLVLLQAHRAKLLKVHIGMESNLFGPMLRTSCGPDEVCLGDSVPEAGEKYPNEQLELEVESVQPPRIKFTKDLASLSLIGAATFFLARNRQPIARIPFISLIELTIRSILLPERSNGTNEYQSRRNKVEVNLSIPKLEILEDVDFFELPASMLEGFRDAARGAILSSAAKALATGVPLDALERRLCPWGIWHPGIQLLKDGIVLLSAELDVFTLFFEDPQQTMTNIIDFGGAEQNGRQKCPAPA